MAPYKGLGFRVQALPLARVQGSGFGLAARCKGLGFRVQALPLARVQGLGFRPFASCKG